MVATAMDEKASSSEDLFFSFLQFAEKAYIIDENIIKTKSINLVFETDSSGYKNIHTKKPINNPESTLTF